MGSYEAWSALVRAALIWAGQPDCASTQDALRESGDNDRDTLGSLFTAWSQAFEQRAVTAGDLVKAPALHQAVNDFAEPKPGQPVTNRTLGNLLKKAKGRIVGGLRLDNLGKGEHGALWSLVPVGVVAASSPHIH